METETDMKDCDMRELILDVSAEKAIEGNIRMLPALAHRDDCFPRLVRVLEQTRSWSVRVGAAEILAAHAIVVILHDEERKRLISILRKLNREAVVDSVVLDEGQRTRVHNLDPYRDPKFSAVPHRLGGWFASIADEIPKR